MPDSTDPKSQIVAFGKELLTALREMILVLLLVLLLLWPEGVNGILQRAGFTQANIAGFTWVNSSIAETQEARQAVERVEKRLEAVRQGLEEIAQHTRDAQIKAEIEALLGQVQRSQEVTRTADRSLQSSVAAQQQLIEQIQPGRPPPSGTWAVVIGGDRTLADAQDEVKRAQRLGFSRVAIYRRQNWYRAVIVFGSRAEAEARLPEIRSKIRDSAYLANLDVWCPSPAASEANVFECPNA